MRILGNVVSCNEVCAEVTISDWRLVTMLLTMVTSSFRHLKLESTWVLSNIAAGPDKHASLLVQAGVLPHMISMLAGTFDARKEAACTLLNIADRLGGLEAIIGYNPTPSFVALLHTPDINLITLGLQFANMLCLNGGTNGKSKLEEAEAPEIIEALKYHDNPRITEMAVR